MAFFCATVGLRLAVKNRTLVEISMLENTYNSAGKRRKGMNHRVSTVVSVLSLFASVASAAQPRVGITGSVSPLLGKATDVGLASASDTHEIVVSLNLRNRDALDALLMNIQDPSSPNYGKFLTQDEFNADFAPTAADEEAVARFLT